MNIHWPHLTSISVLLLLVLVLLPGCGPGDSEARGQARELRERLDAAEQRIATLEKQIDAKSDENVRLREELAALRGGEGIDIEDRQRRLDNREADLNHVERSLTERAEGIRQRELAVEREWRQFYEETNMTREEIGEARAIAAEYENMRAEKDRAVAASERWLNVAYGVFIVLVLTFFGCGVLVYRSYSQNAAHKRETEYRREVAHLLGKTIAAQVPPEQSQQVVESFHRLADIDGDSRNDDRRHDHTAKRDAGRDASNDS